MTETRLIKDINPFNNSYISKTTNVDDVVYFNAYDGENYGLWKTDGTSSGTIQLSTFEAAPARYDEYVAVDDLLFFTNFEDETGKELWVSDGTEDGTKVVSDIFDEGSSNPQQLTQVGNELYFTADEEGDGVNELWKTDGTEDGTESVLDSAVSNLTSVKGTLYFTQDEFPGELWKLNNRTGEAERILENTGVDEIASLTEVDGSLYFVRNDYELWRVEDNSSLPEQVKELQRAEDSGAINNAINDLIEVDDTLFFTFDDGGIGRELYKSNGTADSTGLVLDLSPDRRDAGTTINLSSELDRFVEVEGTLYFVADSDDDNKEELWTSDGTEKSTQLVREFERDIVQPINVGGGIFFGIGNEIWRSDGTEEGTTPATDIPNVDFAQTEAANGDLYFIANESFQNNDFPGRELWILDNTPDVSLLFDSRTFTHLYTTDESEVDRLVDLPNYSGSQVVFNGADPFSGQPVYEFTNEDTGANLYTIDETEREEFADLSGFEAEGTAFYAYESKVEGTVPIYRFQNVDTEGHFLTASEEKRESLIESDTFESNGVAFYAFPEIDFA